MLIMRHPVTVRLWHWITAAAVVSLIYTGFIVFNIHPRLYWGDVGNARMPAVFAIESATTPPDTTTKPSPAVLRIGSFTMDVTGTMGLSTAGGEYFMIMRAANLPVVIKFGAARAWHFAWAWVLILSWTAYIVYLIAGRRLKKELLPTAAQLKPRAMWQDVWDHLRLRRARGDEATRYNFLQKLTYLAVVFILIPLMLISGLTMSNAITASFPELFTLFGGRQSARTVHAICAALFILFILVHVFQLFVAGFINHVRSMITGRLAVSERTQP
jgi:thiosulfate reductase cytochrome b subunit